MPILKPDQIEQNIRSGRLGHLYLFDGPENWLKEQVVDLFIEKLVTPESRDFNFERFDGSTLDGSAVVNAAMSLPFLGEKRLIIVKAAEEIGVADSRIIGEAIPQFPESTCVVFLYEGKANLKEDIPAQVSSLGSLCTYWTPFANQLPSWVIKECRARGKAISPDAAAELSQYGENLQDISNNLDKLILFVGAKKSIEAQDVDNFGFTDESADTKKLETALWTRDMPTALGQIQMMSEAGVRSEALVPLFERVFRTLILGSTMLQKERMSLDSVYSELRLRGLTQQKNLQTGLRNYATGELEESLGKIAQSDENVKTGFYPSDIAMSLLVTGLMLKQERKSIRV